MNKKIPKIFLIISILLFVFSLSQKAYCIDCDCGKNWSGLAILFSGIFGVFYGGACLTWLANPLLLVSWFGFKSIKLSLIFSSLAFFVGLSFFFFDEIIKDESGNYGKITGYNLGFYLWILSSLTIVVTNIFRLKNKVTLKLNKIN